DPTKSAIAWGWDDMRNRAKCFQELVRQYFTVEEMYFPEAFVPPGHAYNYGNNSPQSTGALLNTFGIKYVNGNTEVSIPDLIVTNPDLEEGYTDHGVVFMDRALGADYWAENTLASPATPWYGESAEFPLVPLELLVPPNSLPNYPTDAYGWIEAHFPNYWEYSSTPLTDPNSTYNRWVTYLKGINNNPERMLPKNSEACTSQWFYQRYAGVASKLDVNLAVIPGAYVLTVQSDPLLADYMPEQPYTWNLLGSVTIKTSLMSGGIRKHISSASIDNGAQIVGYYEDTWDYGYLIIANPANPMGRLNRGIYTLTSTLGDRTMSTYVDMTLKTFNVYGFTTSTTQPTATVTLKMYGTQDVKVKTLFVPNNVSSDNPYLKINYWTYTYDALGSFITINVTGRNMNGETGTLTIAQVSDLKAAAKADLAANYAKYSQGSYSADNWAILTGYMTSGDTNIDAKADEDVAGIETAKRTAINGMASVQTLAQTLAAAKISAKTEIGADYSKYYETNYIPADWITLKGLKASGDTNVDAATTVAAVNTAKNTAISGMAGVTRFPQSVVTFVQEANGSVSWTGIKSDLQQWVNTGTSCLPVTAIPDANYFFSGWSGGATGTANPLSVIVNSNMTITANFSNMYALTVNGGSAILNSTPITSASYGTTGITISANAPPSGQTFVAWIGDTANVANVNLSSTTITSMPASNVTITATYKITSTSTFLLTVNSGSGDGTYANGTIVNIVAADPPAGQIFSLWTGNVTKVGNVNSSSTTITMTAKSTVTATYKSTCTLTYTAGAHGTISPTGAQTVAYGADGAAVTPNPAAGYRFVDWTDGKTDDPRTDRNVTDNISVTANFGIGLYTLTYTAGANGTISGNNTQTVTYGLSGTAVTAVPNTGCTFVKWSDNITTATRTATNVRADSTVMAIFSDKKISNPAIAGVTVPATGATPVTTATETSEYTATVTWTSSVAKFAGGAVYTATITLNPQGGYTLTGVTANFFTVAGATSVTHSAGSGVITAQFPATAVTVPATAIAGVTAPVAGATPVSTLPDGTGYSAAISWSPSEAKFAGRQVYTATITLTPKTGYTLTGVTANQFTVSGAVAANAVDSGIITAVFPVTGPDTISGKAIAGVTVPVTGATPVTTATATPEYTATVSWSSTPSTFASLTIYTATITITPKP
ncbi:MAG: hypothetical protein WCP55_06350, partial [Lentisphaerota bacterium]